MTKIIAVLLAFISLLTFFLFKSSDTDTNMIDTTTTTTQPVFLPPGYDMEKIIRESKTLDEFIIYADEFFVFQSSWFARYKEEGKDDVIYSLTCGNDGSKELINRFLENNKTAIGEVCDELPKAALYFDSSFCGETGVVQTCVSSDGYIYISYREATNRFYIGTEKSNKFADELIKKSLLWTPENPVTCG